MHQLIVSIGDKIKKIGSNLKSGEVAEALIATWCVEFLRLRRVGGFNVAQIMVISILMLTIKAIIIEASKRKDNERSVVLSNRNTQMGRMDERQYTAYSHPRYGRYQARHRRPGSRNPHKKL